MKKLLISFVAIFMMIFLPGCQSNNDEQDEEIDFQEQEIQQDEAYTFEHGLVDYNFEKWSYVGQPLIFDYRIVNTGKECEFGLVFLVDGIVQTYETEGKSTSMYTLNMETGDQKVLSIKLTPKIDSAKTECNLNAFVVKNPSKQIKDIKEYGYNHTISSTATVYLEMNTPSVDENIKTEDVDVKFREIPAEVIKEHTKEGINMLDSNVYVEMVNTDEQGCLKKNEPVEIEAYGKAGNYRILEFNNNKVINTYNVSLQKDQYSCVTIESAYKNNDNIYFVIVPADIQDPYDYVMLNQSERSIVK